MRIKKQQSVSALVESGTVRISKNAKGNPSNLDFPLFALGIANKDYPAQTPRLWNTVYQALGMAERNIRLFGDSKDAEAIFAAFRADSRYIGGDVGVGFKDKAWRLVDEIDPVVRVIESINVVVRTAKGKLKGYNTDGFGYVRSLEEVLARQGKKIQDLKVLVLGGGGTTPSIVLALVEQNASVVVLNRTVSKAENIAARVNSFIGRDLVRAGGRELIKGEVKDAAAVVSVIDDQDSPLYKYSALGTIELPASDENISANLREARLVMKTMFPDAVISDIMLRGEDTATIREAKSAGFTVLDGRPMVLNQAVEAFWLLHGQELSEKNITKLDVKNIMVEAAPK